MTDNRDHPEDNRRREDAAIRMEQRFEDFLHGYANDKQEAKEWRERIDCRLGPLEDLQKTLSTPAKIIGAVLVLMVTPTAGVIGWHMAKKAIEWLSDVIGHSVP